MRLKPVWLTVASLILGALGLVFGGSYFNFSGSAYVDWKFSTGPQPVQQNSKNPSSASTPPQPTPKIEGEGGSQRAESRIDNISGRCFSEQSSKWYYFSEENNKIELFESNEETHRQISVGKGLRIGNRLTIRFDSTLKDVDGILELTVSDDGREMVGYFKVLDNPGLGGPVNLHCVKP